MVFGCAKPQANGPKTLVVWMQMDPVERARFDANAAAYQASHPDVRIQSVTYDHGQRAGKQRLRVGAQGPVDAAFNAEVRCREPIDARLAESYAKPDAPCELVINKECSRLPRPANRPSNF